MTRVVICGAGLAGGLAAIALSKRRPDIELVLIDQEDVIGGNHIWSFFDTDVAESGRWVIDQIARRRWPDHEVRFPKRSRTLPLGYNSIQSGDLDAAVRASLAPRQLRLGAPITELGSHHVIAGGHRIDANCVIDARGPGPKGALELGWQKFVGRVFRFPERHNVTRPVIMDATVPQIDGYRFVYLLPLSQTELLIEDTYYSSTPVLDCNALDDRLTSFADELHRGPAESIGQESGVLPVLISGSLADLWPTSDTVPRLGLRAGFFHPTTGYSLADAVSNASLLAEQRNWNASAIHALLRGKAERLWHDRRFFQLLNRMLFRAAEPHERYRVLEHFYRLPQATIERFYGARLSGFDKFRILTGSPPVPIGRALAALRRKVA